MMVAAMTMIRTITTVTTPPMMATKLPEFDDGTAIDGPTGTVVQTRAPIITAQL